MEKQKPDGLEQILEKAPRQSHGRFLSFVKFLPDYARAIIAGAGMVVSLYFAGISTYKAVEGYTQIDESKLEAAKSSDNDNESPYDECIVYSMILGMAIISSTAFLYAMAGSIKQAKYSSEE